MTFYVPVCVRFGDATHADRACTLGPPIAVAYCPTWIIPNADANGYYRSHLDVAMATALLDPQSALAKQAKPTSAERRMIAADLAAMVERAELPIDRALPSSRSSSTIPIRSSRPRRTSSTLHTAGLPDELYAAVTRWHVATFGSARALARLATREGRQRRSRDAAPRPRSATSRTGDPATRAQAEKLADKWLTDHAAIPDDLVDLALSAAAFKGDAARFDRYLAAAKATHDTHERQRLLTALGGFSDPALAARARELVLGHDFDTARFDRDPRGPARPARDARRRAAVAPAAPRRADRAPARRREFMDVRASSRARFATQRIVTPWRRSSRRAPTRSPARGSR